MRQNIVRLAVAAAAIVPSACGPASQANGIAVFGYQVVHAYSHDPSAFTQGLVYHDGFLYEGTGLTHRSSIRKVRLDTGEVVMQREVTGEYFGEGIAVWKNRLLELTWRGEKGFIYDLATFTPQGEFPYSGEGWGFTADDQHLIMSDGSADLRFWDPETFREIRRITVVDDSGPVRDLNELEWVKGEIYSNVWHTDRIARIDPQTGKVKAWIDLTGLWPGSDHQEKTLNGIAYDSAGDRLFVTGKLWPQLFEIRLVAKSGN